MGIHVLYTVGNRDIQPGGKLIPQDKDFREETWKLAERLASLSREKGKQEECNAFVQQIVTPIFDACLNYALRQSQTVDSLTLFVSDQTPPHKQDTINAFEIIRARVRATHPGKVKDIRKKVITGVNVALYDETYEWFRSHLGPFKDDQQPDRVYVCPTAGTPQMSMALTMRSAAVFQEHCEIVGVLQGPQGSEVAPLRFGEDLVKQIKVERAKQAIQTHNYGAVVLLLDSVDEGRTSQKVAAYAFHRLNFDFQSAEAQIEQAIKYEKGQARGLLMTMKRSLSPLQAKTAVSDDDRQSTLLRELYFNLAATWEAERYVDFLGRLFRFQEAVVRLLMEKYLEIPTDETKDRSAFVDAVRSKPALISYLESYSLEYERMTKPVFLAILRYHIGQTQDPGFFQNACDLLSSFEKLSQLRNKSIIAHGFEGVSREIIVGAYGNEDVLAAIRMLAEAISLTISDGPFGEARKFIQSALDRI